MKFKPSVLHPLLKISIEQKTVPFILGAPGIGKSAIMRMIAKELDTELFVVSANLLSDKADLTGVMKTTLPDGSVAQMFYPHKTIQEAISYAEANPDKLTLLFLDEVNRAPEDVQTGLMSLSTERKIGDIKLPDNISITLAGNDSGNVNSVDSATMSRSVMYRMIPDATDLLASPAGQKFAPEIITWLKHNEKNVFSQPINRDDDVDDNNLSEIADEMGEDFNQFTTPRTIEKLSDFIKAAKQTGLWNDLLTQYQSSATGVTSAKESELRGVVLAHIGDTPAANRFLEQLAGVTVGANGQALSVPAVPDSVKAELTNPDVNDLINTLRPEFQNDYELASRTLVGLFLKGATPAMEDFNVNVSAYGALIDMIFDVYPDAQSTIMKELTNFNVISKIAATSVRQSTNPAVVSFNAILQSLMAGGIVEER